MKKTICLLLAALMLCTILTGCGTDTMRKDARPTIVVTIYPIADWLWHVLGKEAGNWDIQVLLDNGADLHSYQATADDMIKIASCALFICVGGESDKWVNDALNNGSNPERQVLKLIDCLGEAAKTEELVEGMEAEEEEEEEPELDEHIWLSLKNAALLCETIGQTMEQLDPEHAEVYQASTQDYVEKIRALDQRYEQMAAEAKHHTVVCADRFPFRYLMDDYHLDYYAAFAGCSADAEASFETVVFLANKVDELDLQCVIQTETADGKLSHTVLENAKSRELCVIFTLDSMQSGDWKTASEDMQEAGAMYFWPDYLDRMEENLNQLQAALNTGD